MLELSTLSCSCTVITSNHRTVVRVVKELRHYSSLKLTSSRRLGLDMLLATLTIFLRIAQFSMSNLNVGYRVN